ncbi:MAG: hypothetical protein AB9903_19580 [Vulcanimicrobiota bacterium]
MKNLILLPQKPITTSSAAAEPKYALTAKTEIQEGNAASENSASDRIEISQSHITGTDRVETISPGFNKFEAAERATNDILVHLVASDTPAVLSIWANLGTLPHALVPALGFFNMFNTATGVVSIGLDSREAYQTLKNPNATKMDKIMDVTHLVAGDVVSTLGSLVPLVAPLTSPVAMGVFVGGQLLGLSMDIAKSIYDAKRKGQQSAC